MATTDTREPTPNTDGEDDLTLALWRAFGWACFAEDTPDRQRALLALQARDRLVAANRALLRAPAERGEGERYRSALEAIRGDDGACARWLAAHAIDSQSAGDLARQEYERGGGPVGTLQARYAELLDRAIAYRTVALVALAPRDSAACDLCKHPAHPGSWCAECAAASRACSPRPIASPPALAQEPSTNPATISTPPVGAPAPVEGMRERTVEEVTQVAFSAYTMGAAANEPDDAVVSLRRMARECADRILAALPVQGEPERPSGWPALLDLPEMPDIPLPCARCGEAVCVCDPDDCGCTTEDAVQGEPERPELDLLIRVACGLADRAPWRQSPDVDLLKDVVGKYRAALRGEREG